MLRCSSSAASQRGKIDVLGLANGSLAGLVAITAGCDVIQPAWAIFTGATAAVVFMGASSLVAASHVDDVVDAVAVRPARTKPAIS